MWTSYKKSCFNDDIVEFIMFEWFLPIALLFMFSILLIGYVGLFIKSLGG